MPHPASIPPKNSAQAQPETSGNKPVEKFTDGPVHVSIWENQGPKGAFRTASFELRYRDTEDRWQTGRSYTTTGLLHLEAAAKEARARIESWRQGGVQQAAPRR